MMNPKIYMMQSYNSVSARNHTRARTNARTHTRTKEKKNFVASFEIHQLFACILRHLVAASDLLITRCLGKEVMAVGGGGSNKPTSRPFPPLQGAVVDASSHHMSDHSCQSTGQRDPGEAGTGGERSNSGPRG